MVYIDGNPKIEFEEYKEALRYVQEKHKELIELMDWEPRGCGGVDMWDNGNNQSIMIEKKYPNGIDLNRLTQEYYQLSDKYEKEDQEDQEIIDQEQRKKMPYTPRKTNLKTRRKKKISAMELGEIKEGEDGKMYICKQNSGGKLFWTRYVEKTYQESSKKKNGRKCPDQPAKEFKLGSVKTGNDGKSWVSKKLSNGVVKWVRQK